MPRRRMRERGGQDKKPVRTATQTRLLRLELQGAEHAKMFTVAKSVSFDILGDVADAMAPIAGRPGRSPAQAACARSNSIGER